MRWLIVEDALRDRKGHWFEYLGTFARDLRALGDQVTILADSSAEPFLVEQLQVKPILPASIWHRMSDGANALRRYGRVPAHAWETYRAMRRFFQRGEKFDVVFVPTVLVHHLLGWTWLIKWTLREVPSRVLLFFPNAPVQLALKTDEPSWVPAPTAKLFCRLIRSLRDEVKQGRVILGAETEPMRTALTHLTGVPFTYFPHPVTPSSEFRVPSSESRPATSITMGSYGSARHEKGSHLLVAAVDEFCRRHPQSRVQFVLQSVEGDAKLWERLKENPRVLLIPNYFANGQYARQLCTTDVLLLPYHRSSYALRVSRVVIEAMVHALPVVATRGTTLASQAEEFGAAVLCDDEKVESLVAAMETMERNFESLAVKACERLALAREHFSVGHFQKLLVPDEASLGNFHERT